jgi:mannose-6-phosphate isomerase-like protein (cupin superfamily)
MKKRIYNITDQDFIVTRKSLTKGVYGLTLIPEEFSTTKVSLTKVEPNGVFSNHIDEYHHVFYFIKGHGIGYLDDEEYSIEPGRIVEIPAGTPHGYRNTSPENMLLITMNIPAL